MRIIRIIMWAMVLGALCRDAATTVEAQTVNVQFNLTDFISDPQAVQRLVLTPVPPAAGVGVLGSNILVPVPISVPTGLTGSVLVSNVPTGYPITMSLQSQARPPQTIGTWTEYFPTNLSGVVNATNGLGFTNAAPVFGWVFTPNYVSVAAGSNVIFSVTNGVLYISSSGGGGGSATNATLLNNIAGAATLGTANANGSTASITLVTSGANLTLSNVVNTNVLTNNQPGVTLAGSFSGVATNLIAPNANQIYVSTSGSDTFGTGTNILAPYLTLTNATNLVHILGGTNIIYVSSGIFKIPTNFTVGQNVTLIGSGPNLTSLQAPIVTSNTVESWAVCLNGDNSSLNNLGIICTNNNTTNYFAALRIDHGTNISIEGCYLQGSADVLYSYGSFPLTGLTTARIHNTTFDSRWDCAVITAGTSASYSSIFDFDDCTFNTMMLLGQAEVGPIHCVNNGGSGHGCFFHIQGCRFNMTNTLGAGGDTTCIYSGANGTNIIGGGNTFVFDPSSLALAGANTLIADTVNGGPVYMTSPYDANLCDFFTFFMENGLPTEFPNDGFGIIQTVGITNLSVFNSDYSPDTDLPLFYSDGNGNVTAVKFTGNGANLTNIPLGGLNIGTPAWTASNNAFSPASSNNFGGQVIATNTSNIFTGTFIGNGSGLTNLNASSLANGTVPFPAFPQTGIGTNGNVLTTSGSVVSWVAPTGGSGPVAGTNINVTGTTVSVSTNVLTNNNVSSITVSNAVTMTSSGTSSPVLTLNATGGGTPSATIQATSDGLAVTANSASPILVNGLQATGTYGIQIPSSGGGITNASQQPFAGNGSGLTNLNVTGGSGTNTWNLFTNSGNIGAGSNIIAGGGIQTLGATNTLTGTSVTEFNDSGAAFFQAPVTNSTNTTTLGTNTSLYFSGNGGGLTNLNEIQLLTGNGGAPATLSGSAVKYIIPFYSIIEGTSNVLGFVIPFNGYVTNMQTTSITAAAAQGSGTNLEWWLQTNFINAPMSDTNVGNSTAGLNLASNSTASVSVTNGELVQFIFTNTGSTTSPTISLGAQVQLVKTP